MLCIHKMKIALMSKYSHERLLFVLASLSFDPIVEIGNSGRSLIKK